MCLCWFNIKKVNVATLKCSYNQYLKNISTFLSGCKMSVSAESSGLQFKSINLAVIIMMNGRFVVELKWSLLWLPSALSANSAQLSPLGSCQNLWMKIQWLATTQNEKKKERRKIDELW